MGSRSGDLDPGRVGDLARTEQMTATQFQKMVKWIGSFAAALGGLDTLVFAGGIGENAPLIRERICDRLGFLGIALDSERNAEDAALISRDAGRVRVRVVHTNEEAMLAKSAARVLGLDSMRET